MRAICARPARQVSAISDIETLDVFCMSRIDPKVPVEDSVAAMAELVKEGKTRFIALSECSAKSLRRGSAVHPLVSLQMEYSLFSRDAEEQGQIAACKALDHGDDGLCRAWPRPHQRRAAAAGKSRHERRAHPSAALRASAFREESRLARGARDDGAAQGRDLAQLAIAWTMAMGKRAGAFVVPIPGAKSRAHLEENVGAAAIELTEDDLAEIDRIAPPGAARHALSGKPDAPHQCLSAPGVARPGVRASACLRARPADRACRWRALPRRAGCPRS